jgi:hypothetical protein
MSLMDSEVTPGMIYHPVCANEIENGRINRIVLISE